MRCVPKSATLSPSSSTLPVRLCKPCLRFVGARTPFHVLSHLGSSAYILDLHGPFSYTFLLTPNLSYESFPRALVFAGGARRSRTPVRGRCMRPADAVQVGLAVAGGLQSGSTNKKGPAQACLWRMCSQDEHSCASALVFGDRPTGCDRRVSQYGARWRVLELPPPLPSWVSASTTRKPSGILEVRTGPSSAQTVRNSRHNSYPRQQKICSHA